MLGHALRQVPVELADRYLMAPGTSDCQRLLRVLIGTLIASVDVLLPPGVESALARLAAELATRSLAVVVEEGVLSRTPSTLPIADEPEEAQSS